MTTHGCIPPDQPAGFLRVGGSMAVAGGCLSRVLQQFSNCLKTIGTLAKT